MEAHFQIQEVPGKGKGLVATHDLFRGMKIISEHPLLNTIKAGHQYLTDERLEILADLQGVSDKDWQTFRGFYTRFAPGEISDLCGRFLSGSFTFKDMHSSELGLIFLNISRITHSCSPNCVYSFNQEKNEGRLYAVKHIEAGEEMTICYRAGRSVPFEQRRAQLKLDRRFDCLCKLCSKTGAFLEESMGRLRRIDQLIGATKDSLTSGDFERRPINCLRDIFLLLKYFRVEGIRDDREAQCYKDAYHVVACKGDTLRAKEFAKFYIQAQKDTFGLDSVELAVAKKLVKIPILKKAKKYLVKRRLDFDISETGISEDEIVLWMLDYDDLSR